MPDSQMYSTFTSLVGFLIVFHTVQAYTRYMSGMTLVLQMMGAFADVMSLTSSFAKISDASREDVGRFLKNSGRLLSLLFVNCLAELEQHDGEASTNNNKQASTVRRAYVYDLVNAEELDPAMLEEVAKSPCKVETLCHAYQTLIAEGMGQGILKAPAPLLTRVYQELGNGVIKFHEANKFNVAPYPFPYTAVADMLMLVHWMLTPFMVSLWTKGAISSFFFTFMQIFTLWSLKSIAGQLDNPYGTDITDLDARGMSETFNHTIRTLVQDHSFVISQDRLPSRESFVKASDDFFDPTCSRMTVSKIIHTYCKESGLVTSRSHEQLSENNLGRKWLDQKSKTFRESSVLNHISQANLPVSSCEEGIPLQTTMRSSNMSTDPHIAESSATSREHAAANNIARPEEMLEVGNDPIPDVSASSQQRATPPPLSNPTTFGASAAFEPSLQAVVLKIVVEPMISI